MSQMFDLNKEDFKKAGIKFTLVLLGGVATYLETYVPGVLEVATNSPIALTIMLSANTALVDIMRKFITDEEGKLGGVIQLP